MARFGRAEWLAIGRDALREGGPEALTIEALTRRAGKTRGSFYHHFPDHAGFARTLAEAAAGTDDLKLERALRRLPEAAPALAAADAARLARFRAVQPDPDGEAALAYAEIMLAVRLGALLSPETDEARLSARLALLAEMIEAHWHE